MKKITSIVILICMFVLSACSDTTNSNAKPSNLVDISQSVHRQTFMLDTFIDLKLYGTKDEQLLDSAIDMIAGFDDDLSSHKKGGDIDRLNHAGTEFIKVKPTTIQCIQEGIKYSKLTDGHFDITVGAVSLMWNFKQDAKSIPSKEDIDKAIKYINYKDIEIAGDKVRFKKPNMKIDLGAIAKGFIADKVREMLETKGVRSGVLNFGGNVVVIGKKGDKNFRIGVQDPNKKRNEIIGVTEIEESSLVTSGVYERFVEFGGKKYHHILDAKTGYPCSDEISQVTIYSKKSVEGDGLSTATFLLGIEKGMELINSMPGVEAVFYSKDNKQYYSENFKKLTNWEAR